MRIGSLKLKLLNNLNLEEKELIRHPEICDVYVFEDDGGFIPHFHIIEHSRHLHTCLCINENKYYSDCNRYFNTLTDENLIIINDWLSQSNDLNSNVSNWEIIKTIWLRRYETFSKIDQRNPIRNFYPIDKYVSKQPDYTKTKGFRNELIHTRMDTYSNNKINHLLYEPGSDLFDLGMYNIFGEIDFTGTDDKGTGICKVVSYGRESNNHYHIFNDDQSFSCCIMRDKPHYYMHQGQCPNTLTLEQKKLLSKFLKDLSIPYQNIIGLKEDIMENYESDEEIVPLNTNFNHLHGFKKRSCQEKYFSEIYLHVGKSEFTRVRISEIEIPNEDKKFNVYVYKDDGNIPHVHVSDDNGIDVALCIYSKQYYTHGGLLTTRLSREYKKPIFNWMYTKYQINIRAAKAWYILNPQSIQQSSILLAPFQNGMVTADMSKDLIEPYKDYIEWFINEFGCYY